jgi:hypothetical protein
MMRSARLLPILAILVMHPGCGTDSNPAGSDGNGDPNDGNVVLLDASNPSDWACQNLGSTDCRKCTVSGGVISQYDTTVVDPNPPVRCVSLGGRCEFLSTRRIDFRPYASARLQCRIRKVSYPSTTRVDIHLVSNVPGVDDLLVYSKLGLPDEEVVLDISLESALEMGEATLVLNMLGYARSGSVQTGCRDGSAVEIHDLRIVAARP